MRKLSVFGVLVVAIGLMVASSAFATKTVHIKSSITLAGTLGSGKVSATNPACVEGRKVAIKYTAANGKGGLYGRATTDNKGKYSLEVTEPTKGPLPYKFKAVVKKSSQGTAGTIYVCDSATSKTRLISGG